jgi:hypothetical protein
MQRARQLDGEVAPRGGKMSGRLKVDATKSSVLPAPAPNMRVSGWAFGTPRAGLFRKPVLVKENRTKAGMKTFPQALLGAVLDDVFREEYKKFIDNQPVRKAPMPADVHCPLTIYK